MFIKPAIIASVMILAGKAIEIQAQVDTEWDDYGRPRQYQGYSAPSHYGRRNHGYSRPAYRAPDSRNFGYGGYGLR